jgi:hypothetical protein
VRKPVLVASAALLVAGCGDVHGRPIELVHAAARRTVDAGSARIRETRRRVSREGTIELAGDRARIVEHGRFGYREYRFLGAAWYETGGNLNAFGEDLGGKWIRHPRVHERERDLLARYRSVVRSLGRATAIREVGDRRYHASIDGARTVLRLDSHGRLRELRGRGVVYLLDRFGTSVDVDPPRKADLYVGHD